MEGNASATLDGKSLIHFHNKMVLSGIPGKVIDKITKELGLQTAIERTQFDLLPTIQPIIDTKPQPHVNIVRSGSSASATIFTTPTDKDFFLTSAAISSTSNNLAAVDTDTITITPKNGAAVVVLSCRTSSQATTSTNNSASQSFTPPILLERGSDIDIARGSTGAELIITGYIVEGF